jgi:hypothetical protein
LEKDFLESSPTAILISLASIQATKALGLLTFDIGTCREEPPFAGNYGENRIWMVVEFSKGCNHITHEISAKRVELLWTIELD